MSVRGYIWRHILKSLRQYLHESFILNLLLMLMRGVFGEPLNSRVFLQKFCLKIVYIQIELEKPDL